MRVAWELWGYVGENIPNLIIMPISSSRKIYELTEFMVNLNDNPDAIDAAPSETEGGTMRPIFVKIKEAIGNYLGLTPIPVNDARFTGTFGGEGTNKGSKYRRNLGGFREAAYTLVAKTVFRVTERKPNQAGAGFVESIGEFSTMTIGFPKGHTVHEFVNFILSVPNADQISAIITPAGRRIDL